MNILMMLAMTLLLAACVVEPVGYGYRGGGYHGSYGDPYNGHHHSDWR